ncbi:MAG TPA: hypothetical protein VK509_00190, partial [Polyangiales bacterium]|nr:hypothetical protein [Polyangiales bacterium]
MLRLCGLAAALNACDGGSGDSDGSPNTQTPGPGRDDDSGPGTMHPPTTPDDPSQQPEVASPQGWFAANTVAKRVDLPVAALGATLDAQQLALQLQGYDPGSLLRCAVSDVPEYETVIDELGGVTWGYGLQVLEDLSKP